jgi:hypothetical protein
MDNKLIRQFGEDILCYRMRTERQKKREKHKAFDKRLMQLYREESVLNKENRKLEWRPLDPPAQKGWKRFFVLRNDVAESKHAAFFANILSKINTYHWHYRKDFLVKRRHKGRKKYVVKPQTLMMPLSWQFHRLDFTEAEKAYFDIEYRYDYWNLEPQKYYVFKEPWRFVLRIRPNIIDKVRVRNVIIETRLKEIENYIKRNNYRYRQLKLVCGGNFNRYRSDARDRDPLKNKSIGQIIAETKEDVYKE